MSSRDISRAFARVQGILFEYLQVGYAPTLKEIQMAYYGEQYDEDSSKQQKTIYGCLIRGREKALTKLELNIKTKSFDSDIVRIRTYEHELCEQEEKKQEYADFWDKVVTGKFGADMQKIGQDIVESYPAFSVWFRRKIWEYAKEGTCFVIPQTDSPFRRGTARWFPPSSYRWNIRELDLYKRTLRMFRRQLARGKESKVMLESGVPLDRALELETSMRAALIDGTVWICPRCSARNLSDNTVCAVCGVSKPDRGEPSLQTG